MPEGDTIWQAARRLRSALLGQKLTRFESPWPALKEAELRGHTVTSVRTHGKQLLIDFDDDRSLHVFLRMDGKWVVLDKLALSEKEQAQWARPLRSEEPRITLILETERMLAVLLEADTADLTRTKQAERALSELGPDLLSDDFDLQTARENLRRKPGLTIAEALLNQSLVAGIGNVYKSEILFIERVSPFTRVEALDDAVLERLLTQAGKLLRRNLLGRRRTIARGFTGVGYYVYNRSGEHCLKCDTKIRMQRQGALLRSTYFCPECQGVDSPLVRG